MSDDPLFFSDDNNNNNNSNNDIEEDLMAAMNAALDDESEGGLGLVYGSEADTESLLSIDVMGEAMNLLSSSDTASATGSGSVEEEEEATMTMTTTTTTTAGDLDGKEISIDTACDTGGAGDAPQDGEEQIDFDDFMAGKATIDDGEDDDDDDDGEGNKRGEVDPKAPDESADAENDSGPTTANGTAASSYSPATTASITDDDDDDEKEPPREQPERQPETTASVSVSVSVPLQQFENALALIQDLEHRVLVLETDRQRLVEDNTVLREETLRQATEISTLQAKLAEFPKLLEETVDEEAKLAAAKAEAETKFSFWKKDMDRQEKESEEEKRKRNRKNAATTDSLKQEDFLKGIVELKEQEEQSAAASSGGLGVVVGVGELLSKVGGSGSASAQQPHSQPPADGPHSELADANDNDNNNDDNNETNNNNNNNNQQPRRGRFSFLRGWGGRNNNKDKEKDENNNKEHKDNDQNNEENEDGEDTSDETDGVGVGVGAPESSGPADISAIATTKSSGGGDEGELLRISRSHDSSGSAGDGPLDTGGEDYGSNDLTNVVVYDPQNPDEKMLGLLM